MARNDRSIPAVLHTGVRDLDELLSFFRVSDVDQGALRSLQPMIAGIAERLASAYYEHINKVAHLRAIIDANSTTAKLSRTLVGYFNSLFAAKFDGEYLISRQRIGTVHDRIGLPLDAYLGAGGVIDELILREIARTFGRRHDQAMTATIAYLKVATMDRAIVARTFAASRQDALVSAGQELAAVGDRTSSENQTVLGALYETEQSAEVVRGSVGSTVAMARAGANSVHATVSSITDLRHDLDELGGRLAEVTQQLGRIDEIVAMNQKIAQQTSLLSLNATIEAARAREHGRGFAVVAEEVRRLAGATRDSLGDISTLSDNARATTAAMKYALDATHTTAATVVAAAGSVSEQFDQIVVSADENLRQLGEITLATTHVREAATRTAEMNEEASRAFVTRLQSIVGAGTGTKH